MTQSREGAEQQGNSIKYKTLMSTNSNCKTAMSNHQDRHINKININRGQLKPSLPPNL